MLKIIMRYDNYEATLKSFPHWYDKNYESNFSKTVRVLNHQYKDKYQKIRTLDYAKRIIKPIRIYKEQTDDYVYDIICSVDLPNLKNVNFYVNPTVDDNENILYYEKCIKKDYADDGENTLYKFTYHGDTRKHWTTPAETINIDDYETTDDYETVILEDEEQEQPIIPLDTFILEVYTYDDYHWLKGFPENDNEDLFRIYKETKSYTNYLTFEVKKQNIKNITILKDGEKVYNEDFFKKEETGQLIYHDYQQSQVVIDTYKDVLVADPDKENYVVRVILSDDDFTNDKLLKPNFDLLITVYDSNNPSCERLDKTIHKRYTGCEKTNYDCFTHDYSLDMLGKYWNVPRLNFLPSPVIDKCNKTQSKYYKNTYPPYNDRLTEDDYHYSERILEYIKLYNKEYFPVLELWKNYQVWGKLTSRKDILSVQDHSYITEYPYYINTRTVEELLNKLEIVEGQANPVTIKDHSWYETILVDNLYLVPSTEYMFRCTLKFDTPLNDERVSLHLYYLDQKGNCKNEEVYDLSFRETLVNTYNAEKTITTREDSVKVDVVLESDISYFIDSAYLKRLSIADKNAMYMATKKDYHSCVYDMLINADDVPSNINFSDTGVFEKLLQRSFPLTHKCFMTMDYTFKEQPTLTDKWGNLTLENLFDETNDHNTEDNISQNYSFDFNKMIKEDCHYTLTVSFKDEPLNDWENIESYVYTTIMFKENETDETPLQILDVESIIKANYWTALTYHFTAPADAHCLTLKFESENSNLFNYKELTLTRDEPVQIEELWN